MARRGPASQRRFGLRTVLIVPLILVVIGAVLALIAIQEWAARVEASGLLDRRAELAVASISGRLEDGKRAKEIYVRLLSRDSDLPAPVQAGDAAQIARVLVPLKSSLGLDFVTVHNRAGENLLVLGDGDEEAHFNVEADAQAGLTRSGVSVGPSGLNVVAASPIKGPAGIVGTMVVGTTYGNEQLDQIRDRSDIELLVTQGGRVIATTARQGVKAEAASAIAQALWNDAAPDRVAEQWGFRIGERTFDDGGALFALIPTADVKAASQQRSAYSMGGLLSLVTVLIAGGFGAVRFLSEPLNAMVAAAASIQAGKYDRRVKPSRIREFNVVGSTMNELSARVEAQLSELTHRAFYDRLTELPNRALLKDRLRLATARARRRAGHVAVMFLDLDNFKVVNDSLGHEVGDALLIALADRLRRAVRPEDTVARLGGDEFVVLVEEVADADEARDIADRLHDRLAPRYHIDGYDLFAMASVGIALSHAGADDPDDLMRNADVAMYHAKSQGKGRCVVFEPSMNEHAAERLALETDLRRALERGEMRVAYQPIVRLESGRIIEVEALLRWDHPTRGPILPEQFIPIAEETGIIVPLGTWVLREAAHQAHSWEVAHLDVPLALSVNLSARQFQHPNLVSDVRRILQESGLDPRRLKLEITESAVMHNVNAAIVILEQFRALGIQVAIDDFGTGYSSLAQLRRLPIDILKIDRAFVSRLAHGTEDEAIIRSIMDLAGSLKLAVTGEGIETADQASHLREMGCTQGQGFFYAHAMPPGAIDELLVTEPPELPTHTADHQSTGQVTSGEPTAGRVT